MEQFRFSKFGRNTRTLVKWLLRLGFLVGGLLVLALVVLLVQAASSSSGISHQFNLLLFLNIALTALLFVWVLSFTVRLIRQIRRRQFGARLTTRFAVVFAVMAIIPGVLIYLLSIQYISKTIESWFNVKVDSALSAGLTLGQASLDSLVADLNLRARQMANELNDASEREIVEKLTSLRESNPTISDAMVFTTGSGARVVGFSSSSFGSLLPQFPDSAILNQLRLSRHYNQVEQQTDAQDGDIEYRIRTIVPVFNHQYQQSSYLNQNSDPYWLQVTRYVPDNIATNLNEVQRGFRDYQELALSRGNLRQLFIITLSLALLLTVFFSIAVALWLARRMVRPLLTLAEGTQAVAVGDFRPLPESKASDEVGQLTRSFNVMTAQLAEASRLVESNRAQLERSNVFLENILASLSAGVIVFDEHFKITSNNKGAEKILECDLKALRQQSLDRVPHLQKLAETVYHAFANHTAVESNKAYWQEQIELHIGEQVLETLDNYRISTLLMRGTRLVADGEFTGYLLVFDDISEVISANRTVAWGEVARRLAHEIKNPLTPIQLSAERLAMKLKPQLGERDQSFLLRSTNTIINQVDALKTLVNDFREYARMPPAQMQDVDLNELLRDLGTLYGWEADAHMHTGSSHFHLDLAPDLPLVVADPNQIRQVLNNLLSNARDAIEGMPAPAPEPNITIQTKLILDTQQTPKAVRLLVEDNGPGFSSKVLQSVFEPYVTTKAHGTGLGLAIVRKIIEEHQGKIEVSNREDGGARVSILFMNLKT